MVTRAHIQESYRAYGKRIGELHRNLDAEGSTLYAGRNVIKTATLTSPGGESITVAIKSFAVPSWPRGFVYAHLRSSKAWRSLIYAEKLRERGIETPDPVASIEYRERGCLKESYYISRYWPSDCDLLSLLYGRAPSGVDLEALLEQLARFTLLQHDNGILHLDYNPGNILTRLNGNGFEFALIDLNRVRFGSMGIDRRIFGLLRLTTIVDYLRIIGRWYAEYSGVDSEVFCRKLERAHRRFARRRRALKKLKSSSRHDR